MKTFSLSVLALALIVVSMTALAPVASADPVGGTIVKRDTVRANQTDIWTLRFRANEVTRIRLSGDGDTCLEMKVYDDNGNLVAEDTRGWGDDREVFVRPRWTGTFKVHIRNIGNVHNNYNLVAD